LDRYLGAVGVVLLPRPVDLGLAHIIKHHLLR
jgi:hypothetical protein